MYNGNEGEYSNMKAIKLRTEQKVNPSASQRAKPKEKVRSPV